MNSFTRFFHELFNPHCEHCIEQRILELESKRCNTCEILQMELARANQRIDELINKLITKPVESIPEQITERLAPIQTRQVPWNVKRQQLEQESRELANSLRNAATVDKAEVIKELEESIGLDNGTNSN